MSKNIVFLAIIFYFLALLQMSFLAHFKLFGINLNFLLLGVVFLNLTERNEGRLGIFAALMAGFLLDLSVFGDKAIFFGFYTLISLSLSLVIKFVIRNYVKIPNFAGIF